MDFTPCAAFLHSLLYKKSVSLKKKLHCSSSLCLAFRDCCAPFKIPDCIPGEHLNWDAWKTTPSIVAGATSGPLENTCASRSHFSNNIVVKLDLFHCLRHGNAPLSITLCLVLSASSSPQPSLWWIRRT